MKKCGKCKIEKKLRSFNKNKKSKGGSMSWCRECEKQYRTENAEKIKIGKMEYRQQHKEERHIYNKEYREKNRVEYNNYYSNRRKTDLEFRISGNIRTHLNQAIKNNFKGGSAIDELGYSIDYFINKYIPSLFQPGMSWNNYGEWELDHIIPLASFNLVNREQFLKAVHYKNYQPLWQQDNRAKGAK